MAEPLCGYPVLLSLSRPLLLRRAWLSALTLAVSLDSQVIEWSFRDNPSLRLDRRRVVILDEAGMARTDDLAPAAPRG